MEIQGPQYLYITLIFCKNLDCNALELLLVQVDKEKSTEFPFNSIYYLYNYYMVCVLLFHIYYVILSCDMTL